jgi:hypothetical protein
VDTVPRRYCRPILTKSHRGCRRRGSGAGGRGGEPSVGDYEWPPPALEIVGPRGLEPRTSSLSGTRSNRAELWAQFGSGSVSQPSASKERARRRDYPGSSTPTLRSAHRPRGLVAIRSRYSLRPQELTHWERVFAAVPDNTARVLRPAAGGEDIWSEWEMSGTRRDKQQHLMGGVIIFGVTGERASWARFYVEPVELGDGGIDAAIGQIVDGG